MNAIESGFGTEVGNQPVTGYMKPGVTVPMCLGSSSSHFLLFVILLRLAALDLIVCMF